MPERERDNIPVAKEYPNVHAFNEDTARVFAGEDTGMYQRYDYKELAGDEQEFAKMIGVPDTVLFNSGMAAIHTAIEAEKLRKGDVVFCSDAAYGVTKDYIENLKNVGIIVKYFDPSDMESLRIKTHEYNPRLFFVETISNSREMKVVDLPSFAELIRTANDESGEFTTEKCIERSLSLNKIAKKMSESFKRTFLQAFLDFEKTNSDSVFFEVRKNIMDEAGLSKKEATDLIVRIVKYVKTQRRSKASLIVDNTLPSPVLINPIKQVGKATPEITVVESGTKHFQDGKNAITMGIVYSSDPKRVKKIKNLRVQTGSYLQSTSETEIPRDITSLMPEKIRKHGENAMRLAKILDKKGFTVYHPNLDSHPQHKLANEMAPNGAVTLFYVDIPKDTLDRDEFMDKVKKAGGESIGLGSSFGHKKTWLSNFALGSRTIRIAVGMESPEEFEKVVRAFEEAINN